MRPDYTDWSDGDVKAAEPEIDPRVQAMQRVVEMERADNYAQRDLAERKAKAGEVAKELEMARRQLHKMLGVTPGIPATTGEQR